MSYIITKEVKSSNGRILPVLFLNANKEIMEFETEVEAERLASILTTNSDSGYLYRVRMLGAKRKS
jgi:hypothetical protein